MEVVVIGAGMAGLGAAHILSAAGVQVSILEARRRLGGRVHTFHDPQSPVPVELGAEFIHGRPREIFEVLQAAGLAVSEVLGKDLYSQDGKLSKRGELFPKIDDIFARMADPHLPDQNFKEFLRGVDANSEAAKWATAYVEGFNAARADRISVRALARERQASEEIDGDRTFRLNRGYDVLPQGLWEQCASRAASLLDTTV